MAMNHTVTQAWRSHAFQLAGIDHVVLEKHHEIVSIRGAALIILPAVACIFDQFGILDSIVKSYTPISRAVLRWPDGTLNSEDPTMHTLSKLFEVPNILFDRQACVSHLYDGLADKSKAHTSRRVELDYVPTRLSNENAKGWKLKHKDKGRGCMFYAVSALPMGMTIMYLVRTSGWSL